MYQEQKRYMEQQLHTDHEGPFGSRVTVSPNRPVSSKKALGPKSNGSVSNGTPPNRRLSVSGIQNGSHSIKSGGRGSKKDVAKAPSPVNANAAASPVSANAAAATKEDATSHISGTDLALSTPWLLT
jgi:Ase1/PRC1/MAP65 family protein